MGDDGGDNDNKNQSVGEKEFVSGDTVDGNTPRAKEDVTKTTVNLLMETRIILWPYWKGDTTHYGS